MLQPPVWALVYSLLFSNTFRNGIGTSTSSDSGVFFKERHVKNSTWNNLFSTLDIGELKTGTVLQESPFKVVIVDRRL